MRSMTGKANWMDDGWGMAAQGDEGEDRALLSGWAKSRRVEGV